MEHIMESIGFMLSKDFKKRMKAEEQAEKTDR